MADIQVHAIQMSAQALGDLTKLDPNPNASLVRAWNPLPTFLVCPLGVASCLTPFCLTVLPGSAPQQFKEQS